MASSRRAYLRRTRKSRMRDLKHSRAGWCGMISALAALVLFVVSVSFSFFAEGEAQVTAGTLSMIGLVLAVGALIMSIMGIRETKVRPIPPRTGIVLGIIMTIVLGGLYVGGAIY